MIPPADAGREIVTGVLGTAIAASEPGPVLATVETFAVLLAIAAIVALAAQRIKLPYAVALVLVGLAVAIFDPQAGFEISPDIVLAVLLPGLVFEAAYQIDVRELRRSFGWVVVLAAPGVVVSAAIVAIVLHLAAGLPLDVAFVVGAIVSATDPVAVVAIFRRLRSPARLSTLVEAESLFNDGTAIVVFTIALAAIGGGLTPVDGILAFVATVLISIAIGVVAGLMASFVISRVDDHLIELTISVLLAYGTYLIADRFEESGVIATVVAGVTLGSLGRQFGMSERTRESIDLVWEFIAFVLNALTFLLIGVSVTVTDVGSALPAIAWGVGRGARGTGGRGLRPAGHPRPTPAHEGRRPGHPRALAARPLLGRPPWRGCRRARALATGGLPAARRWSRALSSGSCCSRWSSRAPPQSWWSDARAPTRRRPRRQPDPGTLPRDGPRPGAETPLPGGAVESRCASAGGPLGARPECSCPVAASSSMPPTASSQRRSANRAVGRSICRQRRAGAWSRSHSRRRRWPCSRSGLPT